MSKRVIVGTASWTDKSLIASRRFYPPKCSSAEDRLRFYASQFPMVRNETWFEGNHAELTLGFERERGFVNVIVDEPNTTPYSIPSIWEVTVPELAIVRLHGRNHATWSVKGAASYDRFNYDYDDSELEAFALRIGDLPANLTQVVFNNNHEDQGQRNARTLTTMVGRLKGGDAAASGAR